MAIEWLPLFTLQTGVYNLYLWFEVHHEFKHGYSSFVYISLLYHTNQFLFVYFESIFRRKYTISHEYKAFIENLFSNMKNKIIAKC